ncbi:23S rRNA (uracil(1939)-C(5))-methyltransferase RlmD [Levilactobacillus brevis]|jgi:23S rRNA (uracil1939-C5)-methyltransferase|uniref:tRNA (Uracil-5-)-methyltransferase related enzyme n=1 Tax=Levilactobacillus brevis (strain ATCC 367 / BCRC 12310 / CIP 105137 / JCM 1170 / LMG 11437 / NCIMB 947 / NCTC 947) TaxID=387344 RepID=Q03Q19_LEVBA|nr:23S rRNA (uracil(1939)-C(5))-methyltransferase RlmD [Levilactobacillus brevis]ABJ64703.1 tRNA (uracil-5-)-methyltransferase related enzyme [Levilactobacillus brevis ATCC 367]KWT46494.1 RNA methyltransferase [Levilactobacillus brevis]KWU39652.1 RNA methyltransferase [Levilactobacillus brevis]MCB4357064.1 23S rRNA (uracil(1939)-C(5))-methyltransferase RlmD [Levilactobacillus brevis]MCS6164415.1 23S rRNA (uracil(1939)-C(5))-methyltransferase RlmD [Levilactobacillus brevis]
MKSKAPVSKNERLDVTITDLTYQGLGVAKVEDFPLFIENTLPGEEVTIQVTKVQSHYGFARAVAWTQESPDRVKDVDKTYRQTGIAPLQHLAYPAQLKFKQHQIAELFSKSHQDVEVAPTMGMDNPTQYRNKAQVPVRMIKGQLETGFYRQHSHELIPLTDFYIQDPAIDAAIIKVRDLLRQFEIPAYNEVSDKGVIRNIMVRRGYYSHEMMIVLISRTQKIPSQAQLVDQIHQALPEVTSIVLNVNAKKTNVIMGNVTRVLYGKPTIEDTLMGLTFAISARSFYQVNPQQTEKLYQMAIDKAGLTGAETVIDAYCGIGTISLALAKHAKQVYGVEIVPEAIEDAKVNAQKNHLSNVTFAVNKAEDQMAEWQAAGIKPDVIVVDPPRKGLAESLIDSAAKMAPKKVVYVSCNPATLVRDVARFTELGYHVDGPVQPVDQFPQTPHVESVTVLKRTEK